MKKLLLILAFLGALQGRADLLDLPYVGVRPSGMGNAFLGLSDDDNVLWYNPAALTQIKGSHLTLLDLSLGVDSKGTLNRVNDAVFHGNYAALVPQGKQYLQSGLQVTYVHRYFALSLFDHVKSFTDLENITDIFNGSVNVQAANDLGAIAGFGLPIDDYLSLGLSVKALERNAIDAQITAQNLFNQLSITSTDFKANAYNYLKKLYGLGWGLGGTAGALVNVPFKNKMARWTIAATVEDVGETTFRKLGNNPLPSPIKSSYNLGTALQYLYGKNAQLNAALDVREIGRSLPLFKQAHFGLEYKFSVFGLRAGVNDGQITYGASLYAPPHTRVHFSSYAIETGPTIGAAPLRLYLLQLEIGFNPI